MKKNFLFLALGALVFASCDTVKSSKEKINETVAEAAQEVAEVKNETIATPEYVGTFEAVIPQADGAGFKTVLTLNEDGTFSLVQNEEGKEEAVLNATGNYLVDSDIVTATSAEGTVYKFKYEGEKILMLDAEGNEPAAETKDNYYLLRKLA